MTLGPAWSSPAERERWEKRLNAGIDAQLREKRNGEGAPDESTYAKIGSRVYRDRRIKAAMPFISIIVQWAVRKGGWTDEYQAHVADKLGVTDRTVRRWQRIADEAEMVKTETLRGRGHRNRYTVLPAALPPPRDPESPRRARSSRATIKPDKNVRSTLTELKPSKEEGLNSASPPVPLPASGKGVHGAAPMARLPRAAVSARGQKATPSPAAPALPTEIARQGASAIRVRAPP